MININHKKLLSLLVGFMLASLVFAACNGSKAGEFPTGKFKNAKFINNVYEFRSDNSWTYYSGGSVGAEGNYKVDGNLWIEEGTSGGECPFPGTYEWTFDGKNLSFKLSGEDNCTPRKEATDGQTFVLSK